MLPCIRVCVGGSALALLATHALPAQSATSRATTPTATSWSVRMTDALIARNPDVSPRWDYTAGLVLLAVHRVGEATGRPAYADYVRRNMDHFVDANGTIVGYKQDEFNLDPINQGRLLFPLFARTKDPRYRTAIETLRTHLRAQPRTAEGVFWHKQIYPQQMWLDGLYMAEPFYVTYAKTFADTAAFTDALHQFLLLAARARDPCTGLMYHAWDASHTQPWADTTTGLSPNYWGRAVGWYLMAAMDVLDGVPAAHPDRVALLEVVRELADAVARVQDPVSGLWYQVLDQPGRRGNYREASGSSMFVYAFAMSARKGGLEPRYRALASRGFDGLVRELVKTDFAGKTFKPIAEIATGSSSVLVE